MHDASATVLTPAAGERHGGRFARPHAPRQCAENGRCAVCSTPASSGGPGRTPPLSRPALWPPYREVTSCRPRTARRRRRRYRVATIFLSQCRRNRPWAVHLQRRKQKYAGLMVNGIFRRSGNNKRWRQPPFTGIALACDKQKKCGSPFSDPH